MRPSIASAPMQKPNQPQAEAAPMFKEQAKVQSHTAIKPAEALTQAVSPSTPAKTQPNYTQAPTRPSIASAPMQKPNQPQAEAAPIVKQSIQKVATVDKVVAAPISQPIAIAAPSAPKLTPPVQPKANTAPTTVAATGDELDGIKRGYLQGIEQEIKKYKTYPKAAKENNNEMGIVKVKFRVGSNGEILKIAVVTSSGSKILDKAAVDLLTKIAKFQALPAKLKKEHMDITLNIDYTLH
jgi:protein TonB